ncbi:flagellar basal body rod protein FlgB [Thalassobacter stenotrophicus]|jgi:flagellar basal-body rod protein FlgB|uniref:flagellar basal body rod protein FlgB n=1 Tax=Thalassobacter TaxID=266808 RepID=UPI00051DC22E|nr:MULTISPECIES: flagellar basal body rod protein FlgB [Thalassobacter]KGK79706.1 flagellar basal body rod protein FlgB [Thalassobacter stenotrophicus]KGL01368.1 flagellar basal body rod protein FlgB [Thalassobacter sp. 16PALIMAR09]
MNALKEHISFQASALALRDKRNTMLASNIANAATPGYKARDLDFDREIAREMGQSPVRKTDTRHVDNLVGVGADMVQYREPLNPSLDGNTVEISVEQMEFSENSLRYMTTLTFLNRRISGLMTAIKGE